MLSSPATPNRVLDPVFLPHRSYIKQVSKRSLILLYSSIHYQIIFCRYEMLYSV
ncbi:hypothetical protein PBCV1_a313aR [Paramecium bursaria Chlorella virus 1]|uniref:Uncharacterized protein n=1 Tax=Paramecium bursaria Chlorella virus 1 TaxID=10506 RepID=F8TU16_PBCV1|nr:hypothetical protein PBCV1_a313aR [Paramecium bursaria Chlorella virus 1]AEI70077.1 hypothetical protein [Paramecium bursaria Chlorella virus 1]